MIKYDHFFYHEAIWSWEKSLQKEKKSDYSVCGLMWNKDIKIHGGN